MIRRWPSRASGAGPRPSSGSAAPDKPTRPEDYTYLRHVEWVTSWLTQLDPAGDRRRRAGLGLADRAAGGADRATVSQSCSSPTVFCRLGPACQPGIPDLAGVRQYSPWFTASRIVNTGPLHELSAAVRAGYDAPFPDKAYQAGAALSAVGADLT